jgi:caffeoyl-CoA O-methyltransferase
LNRISAILDWSRAKKTMSNQSSNQLEPPHPARPVTPMGILVNKLTATLQVAEQSGAATSLQTALREVLALAAGLDPYLEACTTPESPALAQLTERTRREDWSQHFTDGETVRQLEQEMLSGHLEGQALKLFVQMTQARRILEIGLFTGYSALAMAEALPEDGELLACEVDQYVADFARESFAASPHGQKIAVVVAPALDTLATLAAERSSFDLVFIDADKQEYCDYFHRLLECNLVPVGGWICVDNTLLQGQPYLSAEQRTANGEAIARFNQTVAADSRVEQVLLPLRDGLTIIRRR